MTDFLTRFAWSVWSKVIENRSIDWPMDIDRFARSIDRLIFVDWLVGWFDNWSSHRLFELSFAWLLVRLIGWLINWMAWLDWFNAWLSGWWIDWSTEWACMEWVGFELNDWFLYSLIPSFLNSFTPSFFLQIIVDSFVVPVEFFSWILVILFRILLVICSLVVLLCVVVWSFVELWN